MKSISKHLKRFWRDESGADGIEYALLLSLITLGVIAASASMGDNAADFYDSLGGEWSTKLDANIAANDLGGGSGSGTEDGAGSTTP